MASHSEVIGPVSATVAEYRALLAGLQHAHQLGLERVEARSDCRILVSHLTGERTPLNRGLTALGEEIHELTTMIGSVTISWIPSEANGAAHALVTDALARGLDPVRQDRPGHTAPDLDPGPPGPA